VHGADDMDGRGPGAGTPFHRTGYEDSSDLATPTV
jgi:hypothetical protein